MNPGTATYAPLQVTIGRITALTTLSQATRVAEITHAWKCQNLSKLTDDSPATVYDKLAAVTNTPNLTTTDTKTARAWIADCIDIIEPFLTSSLLAQAPLVSRRLVKQAPDEFRSLETSWKCGVVAPHAAQIMMERAAAVYPKLFPGRRIDFLAKDLNALTRGLHALDQTARLARMEGEDHPEVGPGYDRALKQKLKPALQRVGIEMTNRQLSNIHTTSDFFHTFPSLCSQLDDRLMFIVNNVRNVRALEVHFGLTEQVVDRAVKSGILSVQPYPALKRFNTKKLWLNILRGAALALVGGLVAGGYISHAKGQLALRNILWVLAWAPASGGLFYAWDLCLNHKKSALFSKKE